VEIRTTRLGVLIDQLVDSKELSAGRLEGLTGGEFLWEPVDGTWSVRPRDEAATPDAFGPGEWVLDLDRSIDPFAAGPLTTIAWRIGHLTSGFAGRWEWTFGERRTDPKQMVDFTPSAARAVDTFWVTMDRWRVSVATVTEEQLDTVGFSQTPHTSDPDDPYASALAGANLELIHHMAEIALLRDLWRARFS